MNQLDAVMDNVFLHRGMVPAARSRSKDAIFEVNIILSNLESQQGGFADFERVRADVAALEQELPSLSLQVALERAEQLRQAASSLYERRIRD